MIHSSWIKKFKERKIGQTLAYYLGSAWVFIEATSFFINKYNWNPKVFNILILLVIFGLPASIIYVWYNQKFTKRAVLLQGLNGILAISLISYNLIYPNNINPTQLRLSRLINNKKKIAKSIRSIVILPFDNYTGNKDEDFLAFGMHDALISELGQLGNIRVISKTSSLAYAKTEKSIKEIASECKVDGVIEASILNVDKDIRIQLNLISAFPDEQQIWSQSFESDMSNILDLYNRVIKNIAKEIQLTLSPEQQTQLSKSKEVNPVAYKAYLRGMYNLNLLTPEATKKGLEYLHNAIRIDPGDAFAYAGLALGYLEIAHGPLDPGDALLKAETYAFRAIKLDTTMAEIYSALGELNLYSFWKFDEAEKDFKHAIALNPNLEWVHYHYAWALYLWGRVDEAIDEHILAQKIDPLNPVITAWMGGLYSYDGQYDKAIKEVMKSFEIQKDYPAGYFVLGNIYLAMGREAEAIEAHKKLVEVAPEWNWALGATYAKTNHRKEAEKILNDLENSIINSWTAFGLCEINALLNNKDEAFKWLKFEPHHAWVAWLAVWPEFNNWHNDPRWIEFVKQLNLPKS